MLRTRNTGGKPVACVIGAFSLTFRQIFEAPLGSILRINEAKIRTERNMVELAAPSLINADDALIRCRFETEYGGRRRPEQLLPDFNGTEWRFCHFCEVKLTRLCIYVGGRIESLSAKRFCHNDSLMLPMDIVWFHSAWQ